MHSHILAVCFRKEKERVGLVKEFITKIKNSAK
jgi:hypothetical protein